MEFAKLMLVAKFIGLLASGILGVALIGYLWISLMAWMEDKGYR